MAALESRLSILATDDTAKAFASVEGRVRQLARMVESTNAAMGGAAGRIGRTAAAAGAIRGAAGGVSAFAGVASTAAGLAAAYGTGIAVRAAIKAVSARQHEIVRMTVAGMPANEIADATIEAAGLMTKFPTLGQTGALHMLRNARSIVGTYKEAAEIAEPMLQFQVLTQLQHPGEDVSEDMDHLLKAMEIKGVTQNPERFKHDMDLIARAMAVSGDTLKPVDIFEMVQHARQAAVGLSDKFLFSVGPTLAQEMKGSSFGTGLAGFNRMIVSGIGKKGSFQELARIGLVEKADLARNMPGSGEGHGLLSGRTVKGWRTAQENPYDWVRNYLLPAFERAGIKDLASQMREIAVLFPQVSGQLVEIMATQQTRIDKDVGLSSKAPGLAAADFAIRNDPELAWQGLKASIESLTGALGASVDAGRSFAGLMTGASQAVARFTLSLEEETRAQREGHPSPAIDRTNRHLNRLMFGVDTPDIGEADRVSSARLTDEKYRDRMTAVLKEYDETTGRLDTLKGGDRDIALQHVYRLGDEARKATEDWKATVAGRGEEEYEAALAGRSAAGRAGGRDPRWSREDYDATATRAAEARVFGAHPELKVDLGGHAQVDQTLHVDITLDPEIRARIDALKTYNFSVPLAPTGRMDGDAAPHRGGIGHM